MATITKFEDLEVWQIARTLSRLIYSLSAKGNFSKDYALKNQIHSSSGSAMDNIAEGFGRAGKIEFIQFLGFSNGSACEVKSQLYRALD
jgi:four helix bundle protein